MVQILLYHLEISTTILLLIKNEGGIELHRDNIKIYPPPQKHPKHLPPRPRRNRMIRPLKNLHQKIRRQISQILLPRPTKRSLLQTARQGKIEQVSGLYF